MSKLSDSEVRENISHIREALVENWKKSPCNEHYQNGCRTYREAVWEWDDGSGTYYSTGSGNCREDQEYPSGCIIVTCESLSSITKHGGPTSQFNACYQTFRYKKATDTLTITGSYPSKDYTVTIMFA
jgi:hypothetical protein